METARQTALMEQPEIVELFRVLEGNGLTKEQKEVESLVKYLDGMEVQFGQVLEELRDVKEQLSQIQDGGVKASVLRIAEQAQGKVHSIMVPTLYFMEEPASAISLSAVEVTTLLT